MHWQKAVKKSSRKEAYRIDWLGCLVIRDWYGTVTTKLRNGLYAETPMEYQEGYGDWKPFEGDKQYEKDKGNKRSI